MQLVVLAAGHGRRFGGLKQLAPVGPHGEALMDYTAEDALSAGFSEVALVVREDVEDELLDHVRACWPPALSVGAVVQGPVAGTAQAVASARAFIDGPFGVVNADDLYGPEALRRLARSVSTLSGSQHSIIGYRLADTVITDAPVTRGVCETTADGKLVRVVEHSVTRQGGGFSAHPVGREDEMISLTGDETVSMNLWGFSPSIFEVLEEALAAFDPETAPHPPGKPPELLLPFVVGDFLTSGRMSVRVEPTEGACIGITHPDDLDFVRSFVLAERHEAPGPAAT